MRPIRLTKAEAQDLSTVLQLLTAQLQDRSVADPELDPGDVHFLYWRRIVQKVAYAAGWQSYHVLNEASSLLLNLEYTPPEPTVLPEEYAALWGGDPAYMTPPNEPGDGYLFYNFGSEHCGHDPKFLETFLPAIRRTLTRPNLSKEDLVGLTWLMHIVEERLTGDGT